MLVGFNNGRTGPSTGKWEQLLIEANAPKWTSRSPTALAAAELRSGYRVKLYNEGFRCDFNYGKKGNKFCRLMRQELGPSDKTGPVQGRIRGRSVGWLLQTLQLEARHRVLYSVMLRLRHDLLPALQRMLVLTHHIQDFETMIFETQGGLDAFIPDDAALASLSTLVYQTITEDMEQAVNAEPIQEEEICQLTSLLSTIQLVDPLTWMIIGVGERHLRVQLCLQRNPALRRRTTFENRSA